MGKETKIYPILCNFRTFIKHHITRLFYGSKNDDVVFTCHTSVDNVFLHKNTNFHYVDLHKIKNQTPTSTLNILKDGNTKHVISEAKEWWRVR